MFSFQDTVQKEPMAKKQKLPTVPDDPSTLEQRVLSLEKKTDDAISRLKDQVRSLCLQHDPSEALILLTLDELARVSKRQGHADWEIHDELARHAKIQQGQLDLAHFCLMALSGKAGDIITKALSKCKKQKKAEAKAKNPMTETETRATMSPLTNLYPPLPATGYQYPSPFPTTSFGFQYPGQYAGMPMYQMPRPYSMGKGAVGRQWRAKGPCHFCDSTDHLVKDCQKMKLAKHK